LEQILICFLKDGYRMNVGELIDKLKEFNPDVDVLIAAEGGFKEAESVCYIDFPDSICVIVE
jgi:hypothetical protein